MATVCIQKKKDRKLLFGCHLLFIIHSHPHLFAPIKVLYFFRFSAKEPNEKLILSAAWHPASHTHTHTKKASWSFCHKWTHQNHDYAQLWVLSPARPCPMAFPSQGTASSGLPPSRWAIPPYNPSVQQLQTECTPFCHSTLQFLSDVSQQTAE